MTITEKKTFSDKDFWYYKCKNLISVVHIDYAGRLVFEISHKKFKPIKVCDLSTAHICLSHLAWLYNIKLKTAEFAGNTCEYFREIVLNSFNSSIVKEICISTPYNKFIRLWDLRNHNGDFLFKLID